MHDINPAVIHHEAHIRSAMAHQRAVAAEQAQVPERFRDARAEAVAYRELNAQQMYWTHAQCLCQIARGEYR